MLIPLEPNTSRILMPACLGKKSGPKDSIRNRGTVPEVAREWRNVRQNHPHGKIVFSTHLARGSRNNLAIVRSQLGEFPPPTRFDDFIEQTGRTAFASHVFTTRVRAGVSSDLFHFFSFLFFFFFLSLCNSLNRVKIKVTDAILRF